MASSLETNKILAAVLTAGICASGAGVMSRILYQPTAPEEPAYVIQVAAEGEEGGAGGDGGGEEMSVAALLASADVGGGESGAKKCVACHSFEEGGANKIGPALWGVVGRDIAALADFAYSDALNGLDGAWDYDALDAFLANPKEYAPGTKMAYAGMKDAEDRADLILYLRSLAADPLPLPEAEPAETEAAEETGGGESEAEEAAAPEGAAEPADDAAGEVVEEAANAAEEVADAAADVVEGAEQAAAETAETVADEVAETAEAAGDAVAAAAEATTEAADEAVESAGEAAADAAEAVSAAASDASDAAAGAAGAATSGLVAMIAEGDVAKGEKVSKKCKACHVFDEGGKHKLGPALWGIVDRDIGSHEGFKYSPALSEMDGAWTYDNLDQFLAAPKTWAPGTKMVFAGIRKEQDRADLIAYLRTLAAEPAPLQ